MFDNSSNITQCDFAKFVQKVKSLYLSVRTLSLKM